MIERLSLKGLNRKLLPIGLPLFCILWMLVLGNYRVMLISQMISQGGKFLGMLVLPQTLAPYNSLNPLPLQ